MSNLDVLKQGYKDFAEGKMEEVFSTWDPEIVWEACPNIPYINGDGVFKGIPAIVEGVFAHIPEYYDDFKVNIKEFVDGGDKIVMVGTYTGVWKPTGKRFDVHATHTWSYKNGKVVHYYQAVDTAGIVNS
jgi:ketosteroid isomerase-like protein